MKCPVCHKAWTSFGAMRLIGFMAGFDEADRPVLIQQRNCDCEATHSAVVDRDTVLASVDLPGKLGTSARVALEDLDFHLRDGDADG